MVRLEEIVFRYEARRPVLDGVSVTFSARDRVGLVGENGSGKSTLLQVILGLVRPQSGKVFLFGNQCRHEADFAAVRTRLGLLFQCPDDQLFCPTVLEDVAFGPRNQGHGHAVSRQIAEETLSELGIAELAERITYRLSYGQKRMVALACVLAMRPTMLLLDEPTNGLDQAAVERLTAALRRHVGPILLAAHDPQLLAAVTERRLRLCDGRLLDD